MKLILAASAVLAGYLGWRSLGWPLIHDAPLMHYVAWLIGQGAVPYRDVFDMNLPGVYALHLAVLRTLGAGDAAWRALDLAWLGATALVLAAYCRGAAGPVAGVGAALLFALYHLAGGAWRAGQRDFLLCVLLLAGAYGVARSWEGAGALSPLVWGGAALGVAVTVKPQAGLLVLGWAAVAAAARRRAGRSALGGAAAWLGAAAAAPALAVAWLAWRGGLGPFLDVLGGYVLPLYGGVGRAAWWQAIGWHRYGGLLLGGLAALAALGLWRARRGAGAARTWIGVSGAAYGAAHFLVQGKGWEYHLYPLGLFLCLLAGLALAPDAPRPASTGRATRGRSPLPIGPLSARAAAAVLLVATVTVLGAKGVDAVDAPWIADKHRTVAALSADLAAVAPPGAAVQVMDTTAGGIHALLRLGRREPTRFIYDFHFFHDEGDPRIQALRREFATALAAAPPAAVVVMRDTWPARGYDRLARFPEVADLLARRYALAREGDGYSIYARREGA